MHTVGRKGKVICNGGGLVNVSLCDGFFRLRVCAEMAFSLASYVLNVAFVALCHINEIRTRANDVMFFIAANYMKL